jgi:hypothetical protein
MKSMKSWKSIIHMKYLLTMPSPTNIMSSYPCSVQKSLKWYQYIHPTSIRSSYSKASHHHFDQFAAYIKNSNNIFAQCIEKDLFKKFTQLSSSSYPALLLFAVMPLGGWWHCVKHRGQMNKWWISSTPCDQFEEPCEDSRRTTMIQSLISAMWMIWLESQNVMSGKWHSVPTVIILNP